jgi:polyketide synthase 12
VAQLSVPDGLALFDLALAGGTATAVPARLDLAALRAQAGGGSPGLLSDLVTPSRTVVAAAEPDDGRWQPRLAALAGPDRRSALTGLLLDQITTVLGHGADGTGELADALDTGLTFKDLGFDSLASVELRNRVAGATGLRLPASLVFDRPTMPALVDFLIDGLAMA